MRTRELLGSLALVVLSIFQLSAQEDEVIYLTNPSFEDMPRHSKAPRGWTDCGFSGESAPDVQPSGTFSVTKPPSDGNTYMGMVVRDNDTWERVSQPLSRPFEKGKCYEFSIFLCRSELYVSYSRLSDETANYTTPAKLRIYAGFDYCDKQFLLGESNLVVNTRWLEYKFKFEPDNNYSFIVLEAFYKTPTLFPYNGNLLLDNASAIRPIPCDEPLAANTAPMEGPLAPPTTTGKKPDPQVRPDTPKTNPPAVTNRPPAAPKPEPKDVIENTDFSDIKRADLKKGQTIRADKIFFETDKSTLTKESYNVVNELVNFLKANPDVSIEVGGHTNGLCTDSFCEKLSTERAKAVVDYLAQKGIPRTRLQYKGYGKKSPIASNDTADGRRKNQRVEIKILTLGD